MINLELTMLEDNFDKLEKRLRELEESQSFVGYDRSQGEYKTDREDNELDYVDLIKIHSVGVSSMNIPARPIFDMAYRDYKLQNSQLEKSLKKYFLRIKNNKAPISVEEIHEEWVDEFSQDVLQMFGSTGHLEENAESTQDQKGFNAPLVKTGELRDNLGYSINNDKLKLVKNL